MILFLCLLGAASLGERGCPFLYVQGMVADHV